jgi:flagellar motility protein MotE (MotC chaperone)
MPSVRLLATAAILAGGLFILKALEVGVGAADAIANIAVEDVAPATESHDPEEAAHPLPANTIGAQTCEPVDGVAATSGSFALRSANAGLSPSERDILISLSDRRNALDRRQREIDTREQLLQATEMRVDERISELRSLRDDIDALLGTLDEREAQDLNRIVDLYRTMEPDSAADRIAALDPTTQVRIATHENMSARTFSAILAEMTVPDAARLTALIAVRNDPPDTAAELEARIGSEG